MSRPKPVTCWMNSSRPLLTPSPENERQSGLASPSAATSSPRSPSFFATHRDLDTVDFFTIVERFGTKSVTVKIEVEAERYNTGKRIIVTSATMTMVAVDATGKPIPFSSPATV